MHEVGTPKIRAASNEELRQAAELLGWRICAAHAVDVDPHEYRIGLLTTISVLAGAQSSHVGMTTADVECAEKFAHNVMAVLGIIECDDPLHVIQPGACCGPRKE